MSDARTTPRRRCLIGARIAFNNRNSTLDCVLRDISPGGARLEHPTPFLLPDAFDLEIPADRRRFRARVVWRRPTACGIAWTPAGAA